MLLENSLKDRIGERKRATAAVDRVLAISTVTG
jgi:hypothetical protein